MNAIADSNIFIAAWHKADDKSNSAIEILNQFKEGKIKTLFITNYVVVETVNFILRKAGYEHAFKAYIYLTQTDGIRIFYVDKIMDSEIKNLFMKYKSLSITDCSLIALSREISIKSVYSFDKGLDKAKEITRLDA